MSKVCPGELGHSGLEASSLAHARNIGGEARGESFFMAAASS
jgi:hypothetical protein